MRLFKNKKKVIIPFPYPYYYLPVLLLAIIGFFDSVYLAISHYRNYVDIEYQSFCAISRAINCDTVSQSSYSIFLGVPVPVWGVMAYGLFVFMLAFAWLKAANRKRVWSLLMLISFAFSIYSVVLAFLSSYFIHSYCIMCILSYAVNLALLFYTWVIRKRFACESFFPAIKLDFHYLLDFSKVTIPVASVFAASTLAMILAFQPYWHMSPPVLSKETPTGVEDGHPWIGAKHPELVITEFSDYQCFQCKKMHYFLRQLIEAHPDKIRLIHRHFPMDHAINPLVKEPFHRGAAKLSMLAIYATGKGRFWKMNDYLFSISNDIETLGIRKIAENTDFEFDELLNIFRDEELWNIILWKDIKDGIKIYQLTGTPGFIINGQTYEGQIPAEILKPYLK